MGNRGRSARAVAVALTGLLVSTSGVSAASPGPGPDRVDVIVVLQDGVDAREAARDLGRRHDARPSHVYERALTGFAASVPEGRRGALERDPRVAFVDDDRPVSIAGQETPTGVSRIDGPSAHAADVTGQGVVVAILDTGIRSTHEDLRDNVDTGLGRNCVGGTSAEDDNGHGTHVAGTAAAADNDLGVVGVAPGATLASVKVLGSNGSGSWSGVACGIDHAAGLATGGTPVVANLSLSGAGSHDGSTCADPGDDALYRAVCGAVSAGVTVVAAAGNSSQDASRHVPAAYPEVITVSAFSDRDGTTADVGCKGRGPFATCDEVFAPFSNHGPAIDVLAPGVGIRSTTYSNDSAYGSKSGTSMAAPHVAGVAALLLEASPGLSPAAVVGHLRATGQCPDTLVNAAEGLCVGQGTWRDDPDGLTEPMANAAWAVDAEVTVPDDPTSPDPTEPDPTDPDPTEPDPTEPDPTEPGDAAPITLEGTTEKVRGVKVANLTWSDAGGDDVDLYVDGVMRTTANDGEEAVQLGRGGGTHTFRVCETATTEVCSDTLSLSW